MTVTDAVLRPADFDYIRELVRRESAIVLDDGKEYLAENRLHPLVRRHDLGSISALVSLLRRGDGALTGEVVDALTTNETSFFRDGHPWEALRTVWVPELLEKRRDERSLHVWFSAASSGQEPYSFAMLLREHFADELDGWRVRLVATDISTTMLERSRAAVYSQLEVNRGLPAALLVKYFSRDGLGFVADPCLREMVEFEHLNLAAPESWSGLPRFDLVFCRNVLIYFDVATKRVVLDRLRQQVADDGIVLLGSSETTSSLFGGFRVEAFDKSVCYRPI